MTTWLNVGCGNHPAPDPWLNIDSHEVPGVDIVAPADQLPLRPESASRIYCGHVLEHVSFDSAGRLLAVLAELLTPSGELCVVGPDYDRALATGQPPEVLDGIVSGARRWPGDEHQWVATEALTLKLVRSVFPNSFAVPIVSVPPTWPVVSRVEWQCAVMAVQA